MALHERFRTHQLDVQRISRASDGAGGWPETRSSAGTVTGSLQPQSAAETVAAGEERAQARWVFYTDPAPDLQRSDELVHTATWDRPTGTWTPVAGGRRLRVIAIGDWNAQSQIDHVRVDLEEIQHGL